IAPWLAAVDVEAQQLDRPMLPQIRRNTADGARLSFAVIQRECAFRGGVILQDSGDAKARFEGPPDIRPQSVAAGEPQCMMGLVGVMRCVDQVAAQFADVL